MTVTMLLLLLLLLLLSASVAFSVFWGEGVFSERRFGSMATYT